MTGLGIPYAAAAIDDVTLAYYVTCPECGDTFTAPVDAVGEDAITKGAGVAYAEHYAAKHAPHDPACPGPVMAPVFGLPGPRECMTCGWTR